MIGKRQFREMEVREQRSKGTLLKTAKRSKGKEKEKDQGLPSRPSQMAVEERSCTPEQRQAIMTATQMLNSGALDEESFRLLEQLANRIHHQQTTVVPVQGPVLGRNSNQPPQGVRRPRPSHRRSGPQKNRSRSRAKATLPTGLQKRRSS